MAVIASQNFNALASDGTFVSDSFALNSIAQALTNSGTSNIGGAGLDFQTFWTDTRGNLGPRATDIGSDSSDFIGVNSFSGDNAPDVAADGTAVADGTEHNFQFNDTDGLTELVFEAVDLSGFENRTLSFDFWINDTGFESDDLFEVTLSNGTSTLPILTFGETELEANTSADDGTANWGSLSLDLEELIAGGLGDELTLTISVDNNSGAENIFVDNILFEGDEVTSSGPVINEFVVNHTGADNTEFVEVFGEANTDYSNLTLLQIEGDTSIGAIDSVFTLGTTDENGFWTTPLFQTNEFENGTLTLLLVDGFTGSAGDDVDGDNDGVLDAELPWTAIVDSIALDDNDEGDATYSDVILSGGFDGNSFDVGGASRIPNGTDTDSVEDWVRNDFNGEGLPGFDGDLDENEAINTPGADNTTELPEVADPVINEFVVNHTGADNTEFVEVFGEANTDYSNLTLLQIEGDTSIGAIDSVFTLGTTDENGFWTTPLFQTNEFENGTLTLLLVDGFTGSAGDDVDGDNDGVLDAELPWTAIVDSIALSDGDSGDATYSDVILSGGFDGNSFDVGGASRIPNGTDTDSVEDWVRNDFSGEGLPGFDGDLDENEAINTPGAENTTEAPITLTINEVDADTAGADNLEFVELFDGGVGNTSLDGFVIVFFNGSDDASYRAFDLDGFTTNAEGFFVLGNPGVANVDLIFDPGSSGALQNGADAVGLFLGDAADFPNDTPVTMTNLIDAVVYDTNDGDDAGLLTGLGETVQVNEDENGDKDNQSNSRVPDGSGAFVAQAPTPGATNEVLPASDLFIHEIQGSGAQSSRIGEAVRVQAVVTSVNNVGDGNLGGFFVQEEDTDADDNDLTSEGIFIFSNAAVSVGDLVTVEGIVSEFEGETQISASTVTVDANEQGGLVSAAEIDLPTLGVVTNRNGDLIADLEAYEGMLVTFPETLTITELFNLDRFGEFRLTEGERPFQFTNDNAPDVAGFAAHLEDVASRTITVDDGFRDQNPDPVPYPDGDLDTADAFRMGNTVTDLTGVVSFKEATNELGNDSFSNDDTYRIIPTIDPVFVEENSRENAPTDVGGDLKVASFNLLNFFTTIDDGSRRTDLGFEPRGADDLSRFDENIDPNAEFDRQLEKLTTALVDLDADIVGLIEIENDFNFDGNAAIEVLVESLNTALGDTIYDYIDPGAPYVGTDAIATGFIYKIEEVALAAGTSVEFLSDADLPGLGLTDLPPVFDGVNTNRNPLAATFEYLDGGSEFTVVVNHFKSKGGSGSGDDDDLNDGAGDFNGTRDRAADALDDWLATNPTGATNNDVLILGDLNAYLQEDPVKTLEESFDNLFTTFDVTDPYSFVFDGQAGALDYAFSSRSLTSRVTGITEWHINADEADAIDYNLDFGRPADIFDGSVPFRASDHDPIIVGLDLSREEGENLRYILVDAGTDKDIRVLNDGDVIDRADLSEGRFNIRVDVAGEVDEESLQFFLNGNLQQTENLLPYAVFSDNRAGDYRDDSLGEGTFSLLTKVWDQNGGIGEFLFEETIMFDVIDSEPEPEPEPEGPDLRFYLIDAGTDADVRELTDGDAIDRSALSNGRFNIRAEVEGTDEDESLQFFVNGNLQQTENLEPYAAFSDDRAGDYRNDRLGDETFTLLTKVWDENGGTGEFLYEESLTLTFTGLE